MLAKVSKTFSLINVVFLLLIAPAALGTDSGTYGDGVELENVTPIVKILADPEAYIGKTVRVEGGVLDVCPKKGCWIEVGDEEQHIRIKVDDGVIVFPTDATGKIAAAQGKVEAIEMTRERYVGWLAHLAEEKGETFDAERADIGDGPFRMIQIQGTGATIQ